MSRHKSVELTENEFDTLKAIQDHYFEFFQPPTLRDIMERTNVSSTSLAYYVVRRLEEKGMIRMIKGKPVPIHIISLLREYEQQL